MTRFRVLLPVVAGLLLAATGCAKVDGAGDAGSSGPPAADAAVLQVTYVGGFLPTGMLVTRLPLISVYGDGRVVTEGPQILIYPGPALPNVQVQKISIADVAQLVDRAAAAGVGSLPDLGQPPVADAPSTRFAVLTKGGLKVTEVYALAEATGSGLTEEQLNGRAKLKELLGALTDLPKTLGSGAVSPSQPYQPMALAAVSRPWTADGSGTGDQPQVAWPGPALPGKPVGGGIELGCVTVPGDALSQVLAAAKKASTATPWTSGGTKWTVTFRPLLPDEAGCDDLANR